MSGHYFPAAISITNAVVRSELHCSKNPQPEKVRRNGDLYIPARGKMAFRLRLAEHSAAMEVQKYSI
jgi:hypothetical protein